MFLSDLDVRVIYTLIYIYKYIFMYGDDINIID